MKKIIGVLIAIGLFLALVYTVRAEERKLLPEVRDNIETMKTDARILLLFDKVEEGTFTALGIIKTKTGWQIQTGIVRLVAAGERIIPLFFPDCELKEVNDIRTLMLYICQKFKVEEGGKI